MRRWRQRGPAAVRPISRRTVPCCVGLLIFLIIALVAAVLGFGQLEGAAMYAAKIVFLVFLVLFVVSVVTGRARRRRYNSRDTQSVDDQRRRAALPH